MCSTVQTFKPFTHSGRERMNTSPPSPCETNPTTPPSRNAKNHLKNDLSNPYLAKKSPEIAQKKSATTDYQVIALSCCDPYRIQNIEFYEI